MLNLNFLHPLQQKYTPQELEKLFPIFDKESFSDLRDLLYLSVLNYKPEMSKTDEKRLLESWIPNLLIGYIFRINEVYSNIKDQKTRYQLKNEIISIMYNSVNPNTMFQKINLILKVYLADNEELDRINTSLDKIINKSINNIYKEKYNAKNSNQYFQIL